jgi:hypothetical protein
MADFVARLTEMAMNNLGPMLMALGVLVGGWLIALIVAALVRRALKKTEIDNRLAGWLLGPEKAEKLEVELWIGRIVFWILMLFVLVGFFQVLGLAVITEPLNHFLTRIFDYLPRLLGPVILGFVAWIVATALRFIVSRALQTLNLDEKLSDQAGLEEEQRIPLAKSVSDTVYWLVFLLFLPAILGALGLNGLLSPVQGMMDRILGFLPQLFAAGLILFFGWLLARVLQRIVTNLLAAVGIDRMGDQAGLATALGKQRLSGLVGLIVYVLVLIPVLIASLNTLKLDAVTRPASEMLNTILMALPLVFGATLVLAIAYFVGRAVSGLLTNVLAGIGFDSILVKLGIGKEPEKEDTTPSAIVGHLVLVAIMLFASIEAVGMLGFEVLGTLMAEFMVFAGQILLGLIIFGIGLYLADLAAKTVEASSTAQARLLALATRISIMVLAGAMALRQMGLANEIITLAFGLLLGAIAVAFALAFGIGCRDLAGEAAKNMLEKISKEE